MTITVSWQDIWIKLITSISYWCVSVFWNTESKNDISENKLIIRALAGDKQAYEILVDQRSQPLFRYIYHFCGYDKTLAQDALQEVFLHLRKNLAKYDHSKPFKPRLWTLARHKTFDRLKSHRRTVAMAYDPLNLPDKTVKWYDERNIALVRELLHRLPTTSKDIIILYYFEQYSYQEIAEITKSSTNTIGTQLKRWKQKIKEIIERDPLLYDALEIDLLFEND